MRVAGNTIALLLILFMVQACQAYNSVALEDGSENVRNATELVLNGRLSLPLPEGYEKVVVDEYATIVTARAYSVGYRWIDKDEIEFIGSDKSPYHFFKSVFDNPVGEEEKRFLEGIKGEVSFFNASDDIEIYYFSNKEGRQAYLLSRSLEFVVEVLYKGADANYINSVLAHSKLQ